MILKKHSEYCRWDVGKFMSSYRWRKRASSKSSFSEELRKRPRKNAACAKAPSEREDVNTVVADAVRQIGAVLLKFAEKLEESGVFVDDIEEE
ncbi:hypothetical protein D918_00064 [Trichuris suis]|nr:hypothetical protein D918_00064 [Trichuris suis]